MNKSLLEKTSEQLAAIVVSYRVLGINRNLSIECMSELLRRKDNGDVFDYEAFIKAEVDKMPKMSQASNRYMSAIFSEEIRKLNATRPIK